MDNNFPYLIVGLGNPGAEYRYSRHNIGFMLVDRVAEKLGVKFSRLESKALLTKGEHQGRRVVLAKPQTYMNLSGQSVGGLVRFYKVPLGDLLVAYDDVDLPFGTAGQKGMASIIARLGTEDFPRLRLGIGRPPGRMEAKDYVLQDFSAGEKELLQLTLDRAAEAALVFVAEGLDAAMNQFNGAG
jgi:peptidyl-tRNA hydrolase, PTH1 family